MTDPLAVVGGEPLQRAAAPLAELRVAVVGAGAMGADHVRRLATTTARARPVVVSDAVPAAARRVAASVPGGGVRAVDDPLAAVADPEVDAVLVATPGPTHAPLVLACLERGLPVLCEKPLTTTSDSAMAVVRAERATGRRLVQVGFMRRFDAEHVALRALLASGELGDPLLLHCVHRNAAPPAGATAESVLLDSLAHEVDAARFLLGEEVVAVQVVAPRRSPSAPPGLADPLLVLLTTAGGRVVDVELFLAAGTAYEVRTEVVAERGAASIGHDVGLVATLPGPGGWRRGGALAPGYLERFAAAYDAEVQCWADAARHGGADGPGAEDGAAAVAVCEAAVASFRTGERVEVRPDPDRGQR